MTLTMIAAHSTNGTLGKGLELPWPKVSDDFKRFKAWTTGKSIVMGRKTFESIGRPLPNRTNIILSRDADYTKPDTSTVHSLEEAKTLAKLLGQELIVIGGKQVYELALPQATHMLLTEIVGSFDGDVKMFDFDRSQWELESETHYDSQPLHTIVRSWIRKEKLS